MTSASAMPRTSIVGEFTMLASNANKGGNEAQPTGKTKGKGGQHCTHCGQQNHDVEFCQELYPEEASEVPNK